MKTRLISIFIPLLVLFSAGLGITSAQTDRIDSYFISVPVCTGVAGRVNVTWTISSTDRSLSVSSAVVVVGSNIGLSGIGTNSGTFQYIPVNPPGDVLPDGSLVQVTLVLSNLAQTIVFDEVTFSFVCNTGQIIVPSSSGNSSDPTGDPDGDGIPDSHDNCPYDFNPGQEDGWGSAMGDPCDTDWYNQTGIGLSGFEQKDGRYHLHGNCIFLADGAPRCPVIGDFDPSSFTPDAMPMSVTTSDAGEWSVIVHYLHSNHGYPVYQVNVYRTNPPQPDTLVDDHLEFHVQADGSWQWYMRGGLAVYNGI